MATDVERLVVQLQADINGYTRALQKASGETDRRMREIERRSTQTMGKVSSAMSAAGASLKAGVAGFVAGALGQISVENIEQVIGALAKVQDTADRTGLSTKAIQEFSYAVVQSGGDAETAATGLEKFALNTSKAGQGAGDLAAIFKANGVAVKDATGAIRPLEQLIPVVANLVQNATSEQDKLNIATAAFGKKAGPDLVVALAGGSAGLDDFARQAEAAGIVVDGKLVKAAGNLDDQIQKLKAQLAGVGAQFAVEVGGPLVISAMTDTLSLLRDITYTVEQLKKGNLKEALGVYSTDQNYLFQGGARKLRGRIGTSSLSDDDIKLFYDRTGAGYDHPNITASKQTRPTVVPVRSSGGGSSYKRTADDRIDEDIARIRDRTAALQLETQTVGLSYEEQEKRKMALDLEQEALAALRAEAVRKGQTDVSNIKLSKEQTDAIHQVAAGYAMAADAYREASEQQQRAEQAASEFYDTFKDGMIGAITGANSLKDALAGVLKKLSDMVLSAAFDSLFSPSRGGSGGGLLGGISDGIGKLIGFRAGGGPVKAGQPYVVGEKRAELFVPGANGMIVPKVPQMPNVPRVSARGSSTTNVSYAPQINVAQGADPKAIAELRSALAQDRRDFETRTIAAVRKAQKQNVKLS